MKSKGKKLGIRQETLDLFDKYIKGSLNKKQIMEFEIKVRTDNEFSEAFTDYKYANDAIRILSRERLRNKLAGIISDQESAPAAPLVKPGLKEVLSEIFHEFFIPLENVLTFRSASSADNEKQTAMSYYSGGDFKKASTLFKKLQKKNPTDFDICFYYAISEMALENYDNSKKLFKKIVSGNNDFLKARAAWYLGLTLLKSGNVKSAIKQFESLSSKDSDTHSKNILKRIQSLK